MILVTPDLHLAFRANARLHHAAQVAGTAEPDPAPLVKFFHPAGAATWLMTELDEDGFTCFGLADLGFGSPELGSFSLREIGAVRLPFGLRIERDIGFSSPWPLSLWTDWARREGSILPPSARSHASPHLICFRPARISTAPTADARRVSPLLKAGPAPNRKVLDGTGTPMEQSPWNSIFFPSTNCATERPTYAAARRPMSTISWRRCAPISAERKDARKSRSECRAGCASRFPSTPRGAESEPSKPFAEPRRSGIATVNSLSPTPMARAPLMLDGWTIPIDWRPERAGRGIPAAVLFLATRNQPRALRCRRADRLWDLCETIKIVIQ